MDTELLAHIAESPSTTASPSQPAIQSATGSTARALMPWIILTAMVSLWACLTSIKRSSEPRQVCNSRFASASATHTAVVEKPTEEKAEFELKWLSATGTALLFTGILSGLCLGLGPVALAAIFFKTLRRTATSLATIAAMLALGFTTRYSGLDATMGLAMASTGWLFPFFSPLLGWLGVALTAVIQLRMYCSATCKRSRPNASVSRQS